MSLLSAVHEYTSSCRFDRKNKRSEEEDEEEETDVVVVSSRSVKCSNDEAETVVMNRLKERQRNRRRRRKSSLSSSEDKNEKDGDEVQTLPIVLSVDTDNIAALRLYEKFGFEYLEQNDIFCMMKFEEYSSKRRRGCSRCKTGANEM